MSAAPIIVAFVLLGIIGWIVETFCKDTGAVLLGPVEDSRAESGSRDNS